ncbi:MAG: HDOD domain-containing protein [Leptothrix sp. (in: b-proteobacteria)]
MPDELTPVPTPDAAQAEADAAAAEHEARLQRLLERMTQHPDFPSLKESIRTIQSVARSETAHVRAFSEQIMQDVALTAKLLRLINTAFYSSAGAGQITTIQRVIALMGFQPVGRLAASIKLFDRLPQNGAHLPRLRREFARGLLAGLLAHQFCPVRQLEETAYISALFQQLGQMLVWMHFPQDASAIEAACLALCESGSAGEAEVQSRASRDVLGLSYEELGVEVARLWGWPETLLTALRPLQPADNEQPVPEHDYLRVLCTAANELADELIDLPAHEHAARLPGFFHAWGLPLSLAEEDLEGMVGRAHQQWQQMALTLSLAKPRSTAGKAATAPASPATRRSATAPPPPATGLAATPRGHVMQAAAPIRPPPPEALQSAAPGGRPHLADAARLHASNATDALSQGIEQLSQSAMGDAPLTHLLQQAMQIMHSALQLRRVVICLREEPSGVLQGSMGLGEQGATLAPRFRIPTREVSDLFGMLCLKAADTLISDSSDALIARHLPSWFHEQVQAPTFVVLPMTQSRTGHAPHVLGMLYGDCAHAGGLLIDERQLSLLKTLRNQLVMALRLRGSS